MIIIILRIVAFILLTVITGYVDVSMYWGLGANLAAKLRLSGTMLSLLFVKTFSLLRMETIKDLRVKHNKKFAGKTLFISSVLYFSLAILSVINTSGANLAAIDKQASITKVVESSEDYNFDIKQLDISLSQADSNIASLIKQLDGINPDYATGIAKINSELSKAKDSKESLLAQRRDLVDKRKQSMNVSTSEDANRTFELMGQVAFNRSALDVMKFLVIILAIIAEAGIYFTSPTLPIKEKDLGKIIHGAKELQEASKHLAVIEDAKRPSQDSLAEEYKPPVEKTKKRTYNKKRPAPTVAELVRESADVLSDSVQVQVSLSEPTVESSTSIKKSLTKDELLEKILTPKRGVELPSVSDIAYETGLNVDKLTQYVQKISKIKGPNGVPVIYLKDGKWFLSFSKNQVMSLVKGVRK